MKKTYEKPQIIFESFEISTNIASGCEAQTNLQVSGTCGYNMSGLVVFITGMTGCYDIQVDKEGGDGQNNGLCYHVLTGDKNLFNS